MFKKKFSYLLFILFLFSFFRLEVNAAVKTLSCYYYNDSSDYVVLFTQSNKKDEDGSYGYVYAAKKNNVMIDGKVSENGNWGNSLGRIKSVKLLRKDSNYAENYSYFDSCPKAISWKGKKPSASSMYAFPIANHDVYNKHKNQKNIWGNNKFVVMEKKGSFNKYIDTTTELSNNHGSAYNGKTCDNATWLGKKGSSSCLYTYYHDDKKDNFDGCFVVQIDFDSNGRLSLQGSSPNDRMKVDVTKAEASLNSSYLKTVTNGECPGDLYGKEIKGYAGDYKYYTFSFDANDRGDKYLPFYLKDWDGQNVLDPTKDMTGVEYGGYNLDFVFDEDITCADIIGEDGELVSLLNTLIKLTKILVPVLLIVFGSLDFAKAIFSGDESGMKKAQSKFVKRLIISVAFFIAPTILKFILEIAHSIWDVVDADLCGIL